MSDKFITKDSGQRQEFQTGSLRDTNEGKPRYDLISIHGLKRLADLMARGAKKYGERNWEKGQPVSRFYESLFRHLIAYREGDRSEDHLAAITFNTFGIIHMEEENREDMLDFDFYKKENDDLPLNGNPFTIVSKDGGKPLFQFFSKSKAKKMLDSLNSTDQGNPWPQYVIVDFLSYNPDLIQDA